MLNGLASWRGHERTQWAQWGDSTSTYRMALGACRGREADQTVATSGGARSAVDQSTSGQWPVGRPAVAELLLCRGSNSQGGVAGPGCAGMKAAAAVQPLDCGTVAGVSVAERASGSPVVGPKTMTNRWVHLSKDRTLIVVVSGARPTFLTLAFKHIHSTRRRQTRRTRPPARPFPPRLPLPVRPFLPRFSGRLLFLGSVSIAVWGQVCFSTKV